MDKLFIATKIKEILLTMTGEHVDTLLWCFGCTPIFFCPLFQIFIFLLSMCLVCTIACGIFESVVNYEFQVYLPWESYVPGTYQNTKEGSVAEGATVISLLVFFSYIIVLNTVVPISLYVR